MRKAKNVELEPIPANETTTTWEFDIPSKVVVKARPGRGQGKKLRLIEFDGTVNLLTVPQIISQGADARNKFKALLENLSKHQKDTLCSPHIDELKGYKIIDKDFEAYLPAKWRGGDEE